MNWVAFRALWPGHGRVTRHVSEGPRIGRRGFAALSLGYATVSLLAYLLIQPPAQGGVPLWFPPTGLAFGYLVVAGVRGFPLVIAVRVAGTLLLARHHPTEVVAVSATWYAAVVSSAWYALIAQRLLSTWQADLGLGWLARWLGWGIVAGPFGAATLLAGLDVAQGGLVGASGWARAVSADTTSIATLTPAVLAVAIRLIMPVGTAEPRALTQRRRTSIAAQAAALAVLPAMALVASTGSLYDVAMLPLALAPLGALAVGAGPAAVAASTALVSVLIACAAQVQLGSSEGAVRVQAIVFAAALATVFAVTRIREEAGQAAATSMQSRRWQALLKATPAVVARVDSRGVWHRDESADVDPRSAAEADAVAARLAEDPEVQAAVTAAVARTVHWGVDEGTGRRFVTHVTPLPDGDALAVTTETSRLHSAELALAWERSHDRDTDLPNRDLLLATAEQAIADAGLHHDGPPSPSGSTDRGAGDQASTDWSSLPTERDKAGRRPSACSLIVIDCDHATRRAPLLDIDPARLMLVLAERLAHEMDSGDLAEGRSLVARTGDDQFTILVQESITQARDRASRMLAVLGQNVGSHSTPMAVHAWAGIAALDPERPAAESFRRACAAAHAASEAGGQSVTVLDGLAVTTAAERARLTAEVYTAVERGELEVVFQPDVALPDGRLTGVEALVRWRRRGGFAAATDVFIKMAEETGAVRAIDAWVMDEALSAAGHWRRNHGATDLEIALNVSAHSLTEDLPDRLFEACLRHDVPPWAVRLEVTETALGDSTSAPAILRRVRARGARVALDDFGTGYATLSRLHRLPVDVVKLDRSFLVPITESRSSQALVSLVLGLAGPLRVEVVVEGVETETQRDILIELGCRRAQGFLFARPAGADAIARILDNGGHLHIGALSASHRP